MHVVKDALASCHLIVVPFALPLQELIAVVGCLPKTLISCSKSFLIALFMIFHCHICAVAQVTRFSVCQIELIVDFLTLVIHEWVADFLILLVYAVLPGKLCLTLLFYLIYGAQGRFLFPHSILINFFKCFFRILGWSVEAPLSILLFLISHLHRWPKFYHTLLGMEHLIVTFLLLMCLHLFAVFLVTFVA